MLCAMLSMTRLSDNLLLQNVEDVETFGDELESGISLLKLEKPLELGEEVRTACPASGGELEFQRRWHLLQTLSSICRWPGCRRPRHGRDVLHP